jgi:hypothetical protein
MTSPRCSRGHELPDHRQAKARGAEALREAGFDLVLFEYGCADLVGIRRLDGQAYVLTVEFERTPRNIIANVRRDLAFGSDRIVIACLPPLRTVTVQRLLARRVAARAMERVTVVQSRELSPEWLGGLRDSAGVDSGLFGAFAHVDSAENGVSSGRVQVDSRPGEGPQMAEGRCPTKNGSL